MDFRAAAELSEGIKRNIQQVIIGKDEAIRLVLCALFAGRHVLLEDVPGTGKTMLAKALAKSVDGSFTRVQFTPDLLPADVTGQAVYQPNTGDFVFRPGPIFANIVLADEINRATPRSQAALLECMEEGQVTVDGATRELEAPFLVIATQNPVEMQGTFPLPEAQLDRFFVRVRMGYPSTEESGRMLRRFVAAEPLRELSSVATLDSLRAVQRLVSNVHVSDAVQGYIVAVCENTRTLESVRMGASPRAMLALMRAAQSWALYEGRDFVIPEDVHALAVPVLAHRLLLRSALARAEAAEEAVRAALQKTPAPTEGAA